MTESLVNFVIGLFGGIANNTIGKYMIISLLSMAPIAELRGGMIAAALLNMDPFISFVVCLIANFLPIPFILILIKWIFKEFKKTKLLGKFVDRMEKRVEKKRGQIDKYGYFGLFLFVGIPLPGTGGWTGALVAALLNLDKKKSLITIAIGIFTAGLIMFILSFGLLKGIIN